MVFTRSFRRCLSTDRGSRDSGAPALAASRCQASASAMLSLAAASSASALAAHSAAIASWPSARRISSSRSRTARAAPLSRALNSLNTSWSFSTPGWVDNHSRMRAERSPDVAAEKAPPVNASRGCGSLVLAGTGVASDASDILLREEKGNMDSSRCKRATLRQQRKQ